MNRGKTANMFEDDYDEEITEFFDELKVQKEEEELRQAFSKFVNHSLNKQYYA